MKIDSISTNKATIKSFNNKSSSFKQENSGISKGFIKSFPENLKENKSIFDTSIDATDILFLCCLPFLYFGWKNTSKIDKKLVDSAKKIEEIMTKLGKGA